MMNKDNDQILEMCFISVMLDRCCRTWKAFARAWAPSFSRRFRPATNTLSFSGDPLAEDCLWHSIRASAKIYKTHTHTTTTIIITLITIIHNVTRFSQFVWTGGIFQSKDCTLRGLLAKITKKRSAHTFPPPMPMPQLLSFSSLSVWQEGLFSSCSIAFTPSGPKALSLKSSSVSRAPELIMALLRCFWWRQTECDQD